MVLSLLAQLVILLSPGCSKEDTLVEITDWAATENVSAGESAKYLTFFEKASEEMDYCRALTCTDAGLEVVLQSNASITLPAGPLIWPCLQRAGWCITPREPLRQRSSISN